MQSVNGAQFLIIIFFGFAASPLFGTVTVPLTIIYASL